MVWQRDTLLLGGLLFLAAAALRRPARSQKRQRAAYGFTAESKVLLFAGRLVPKKGIDHVIEVQRALAREGAHLLVAGDGGAPSIG